MVDDERYVTVGNSQTLHDMQPGSGTHTLCGRSERDGRGPLRKSEFIPGQRPYCTGCSRMTTRGEERAEQYVPYDGPREVTWPNPRNLYGD